jgi:hypothetical protein
VEISVPSILSERAEGIGIEEEEGEKSLSFSFSLSSLSPVSIMPLL